MHNFTIDYTDGLKIDNNLYDPEFATGSVVTKNIKPHYLAYGNPARHI